MLEDTELELLKDELEPLDDEPELPEDELEPLDDEPKLPEDELELLDDEPKLSEDELEPLDDELELPEEPLDAASGSSSEEPEGFDELSSDIMTEVLLSKLSGFSSALWQPVLNNAIHNAAHNNFLRILHLSQSTLTNCQTE